MKRGGVVLGLALLTASCNGSWRSGCAKLAGGTITDDEDAAVDSGASKWVVTQLARDNDRFQGLGLDDKYIYVGAMVDGPRRVPKAGGPLEKVDTHGSAGPAGKPDPARAYFNGYSGIEKTSTSLPSDNFSIEADGIYRTPAIGKKEMIARSFLDPATGNIARKEIVLDDAAVYWLEDAAGAIFSVPRGGGAVSFVTATKGSLVGELAIYGDRLYQIGIDGSFTSTKKNGGDSRWLGSLSSDLGPNLNSIWAAVDGDFLYVASDATESMGTTATPLGGSRYAVTNSGNPVFDSRILKIALPVGGDPLPPSGDGLIFPLNVWLSDLGPDNMSFRRGLELWKPFSDLLAKGQVPLIVSLRGGSIDASVEAQLAKIETWVRASFGAGVMVERSNVAPGAAAQSVVVGFPISSTWMLMKPAETKP